MYTVPKYENARFKVNKCVQGETLETKIERIISNKEPIKDGAPIIYTERKEGIRASTNIRTDRFEVAVDATDRIAKSYKARREENAKPKEPKTEIKDTKGEPIQGGGETPTS